MDCERQVVREGVGDEHRVLTGQGAVNVEHGQVEQEATKNTSLAGPFRADEDVDNTGPVDSVLIENKGVRTIEVIDEVNPLGPMLVNSLHDRLAVDGIGGIAGVLCADSETSFVEAAEEGCHLGGPPWAPRPSWTGSSRFFAAIADGELTAHLKATLRMSEPLLMGRSLGGRPISMLDVCSSAGILLRPVRAPEARRKLRAGVDLPEASNEQSRPIWWISGLFALFWKKSSSADHPKQS